MKKLILFVLMPAILITIIPAMAQVKTATISTASGTKPDSSNLKMARFDQNNLPGHDYGIDVGGMKPPKPPKDPHLGGKPDAIKGDIAVKLKKINPVLREACADHFTINYKTIAKNNTAEAKLSFRLRTDITYNFSDDYAAQTITSDTLITVNAADSIIINGSVDLKYAYIPGYTKGSAPRKYVSRPVTIKATIYGGTVPGNQIPHIILKDSNSNNNTDELNIDSPLPLACIKMAPAAQTE